MPDDALIEQLDRAIDALLRGGSAEGPVPGDLVEVARALREMPDDNFKLRLKSQLERRVSMSAAAIGATQIREGFRTVTPYLTLAEGDKFIEFLKQTFQAEEVLRHA